MRICFYLICFLQFYVNIVSAQTCKSDSIPASTPDSQLVDNGNGTISDLKTSLMWKKCMEGFSGNVCDTVTANHFNWQQALEQPEVINGGAGFAGYYDWRLPNIKELSSIVEIQCFDPSINSNRFPGTTSSSIWAGSPYANSAYYAWYVNFYNGKSSGDNRNGYRQVRLVRSGQ